VNASAAAARAASTASAEGGSEAASSRVGADHELCGAAADVADGDALRRLLEGGDRAVPREHPLLFGAEDAHRHTGSTRERVRELVAVAALTAGRGDEDRDPLAAEPPCATGLRAGYLDRLRALRRADVAVALDLLAQAELLLLLMHGQDLTAVRDGNEQAKRVRAYVDDCDSHRLHCSRRVG
jgi:hypothetical protein